MRSPQKRLRTAAVCVCVCVCVVSQPHTHTQQQQTRILFQKVINPLLLLLLQRHNTRFPKFSSRDGGKKEREREREKGLNMHYHPPTHPPSPTSADECRRKGDTFFIPSFQWVFFYVVVVHNFEFSSLLLLQWNLNFVVSSSMYTRVRT